MESSATAPRLGPHTPDQPSWGQTARGPFSSGPLSHLPTQSGLSQPHISPVGSAGLLAATPPPRPTGPKRNTAGAPAETQGGSSSLYPKSGLLPLCHWSPVRQDGQWGGRGHLCDRTNRQRHAEPETQPGSRQAGLGQAERLCLPRSHKPSPLPGGTSAPPGPRGTRQQQDRSSPSQHCGQTQWSPGKGQGGGDLRCSWGRGGRC